MPKRADESQANEPRREAAKEDKMTPGQQKAYERKEPAMPKTTVKAPY